MSWQDRVKVKYREGFEYIWFFCDCGEAEGSSHATRAFLETMESAWKCEGCNEVLVEGPVEEPCGCGIICKGHERVTATDPFYPWEKLGQRANEAAALKASQPCLCFGPPVKDCVHHGMNCRTGDIGEDD
jgi:hypothetical protein